MGMRFSFTLRHGLRALFVSALLAGTLASTAHALQGTAALLPLNAKQVNQDEADILTDALINELSKTGSFQMMERSQMDQILKEQGFQQSGACDAGQCAVEMGRLLGIQTMLTGSIGRLGDTYVLSTRMVDVRTGAILKSTSRNVKGSISDCLEDLLPAVAKDLAKGEDKVAARPAPVAPKVETVAPPVVETPKPVPPPVVETPKPVPPPVVEAPKPEPKPAAVAETTAAKPAPEPAKQDDKPKTRIWPWVVGGTVVAGGAAAAVLLLSGKSGKKNTTPTTDPVVTTPETTTLDASWEVLP